MCTSYQVPPTEHPRARPSLDLLINPIRHKHNHRPSVYVAATSQRRYHHCYTSKLLTLIVLQVSSLQVLQVSHFSHKVASVACCSQVSQVSSKEYCHDAYVMPITTWERHLKHLKHLIWKRRNESTGLQTFCHLKAPQKLSFWRGALPYTSYGSTDAPPYTVRERYNAPLALLRERYRFWKRWRPPKA